MTGKSTNHWGEELDIQYYVGELNAAILEWPSTLFGKL